MSGPQAAAQFLGFDGRTLWEQAVEEAERSLRKATELIAGDGDGETSIGLLRSVRVAVAHGHGRLLDALQTARSRPHPARRMLPLA